jgi:hypothetical protein
LQGTSPPDAGQGSDAGYAPDGPGSTTDGPGPTTDGAGSPDAGFTVDASPSGKPPSLTPGVWTNITPPGVNLAPGCCTMYPHDGFNGNTFGVIWVELAPSNPYVMYVSVDVEGMWKSTDGGATWKSLGTPPPAPTYAATVGYLDSPGTIRVDPHDANHLYATQGVRGSTLGFWESTDGGQTWTQPPGFVETEKTATNDVTTMVVDPSDFLHVLIGSHSPWNNAQSPAGILETKDGGQNFIQHPPVATWNGSATNGINFLYNPSLGIGSSQTWLYQTASDGVWLTKNGAATWTQVASFNDMHGGNNDLYYTKAGVIYAGGNNSMMRSTDQGASWSQIGPSTQDGYYQIMGDGNLLYALAANTGQNTTGAAPYITSPETDGTTWTPYMGGSQKFSDGPFKMDFDPVNRIIYSANWDAGLWALKVQ